MHIGIDIRSTLKKEKTGIGYYTLNLVNALAGIDRENSYYLYSRIKPFSRSKKLPALPADNFKYRVDRLGVGPPVILRGVDIFHTSGFDLRPPKGAKFVVTVHDIIPRLFPQWHTPDAIDRLELGLARVLTMADVITTDAQCTAKDLLQHYPVECKDKVKVVYLGVEEELTVLKDRNKILYRSYFLGYNIEFNYILYVGTLEPRKNIKGLIKAYHKLKRYHDIKQQLVIIGMKGWSCEDIFQLVEELQLTKEVIFTGYVSKEELKIFYNFADVCVYPSFYEGAGLPVLEAFKCGCPVVTSNVSSMFEFAGDAAVLVDPHSADSIAEGIYSLLSNQDLKNELRKKGLKRIADFTWDKTARQMLNIYNEVAG